MSALPPKATLNTFILMSAYRRAVLLNDLRVLIRRCRIKAVNTTSDLLQPYSREQHLPPLYPPSLTSAQLHSASLPCTVYECWRADLRPNDSMQPPKQSVGRMTAP